MSSYDNFLNKENIEAAAKNIRGIAIRTPLQYNAYLSNLLQANIYLKKRRFASC